MNKKIITPITLILLIGLPFSVSAVLTKQDFQQITLNDNFGSVNGDQVNLNLKQGWNLLPLKFIAEAGGRYWSNYENGATTCEQEIFQNVWYYSPEFGDYYHVPVDKDEQLANIDDWRSPKTRGNDFLLGEFQNKFYNVYAGSAWIYSEKPCSLRGDDGIGLLSKEQVSEEQGKSYKYDELTLKAGWNFIPVDMLMSATEVSFGEIFARCNIIKYNVWDNANQDWIIPKENMQDLNQFNNEIPNKKNVFDTMVLKIGSDCKLGENIYNLLEGTVPKPINIDKCTEILENGPIRENVDLVFVPNKYSNLDLWQSDVNEYMDVFFSYEPMKSTKEKFNVWRINELNEEYISDITLFEGDKIELVKQNSLDCVQSNPDMIFVISDNSDYPSESFGFALYPHSIAAQSRLRGPAGEEIFSSKILIHEFGHAFANLGDEYENSIQIQDFSGRPNLDIEGCPKWCSDELNENSECYLDYLTFKNCLDNITNKLTLGYNGECSYNSDITNCDLGKECLDGTGCYWNAKSLIAFRSSTESIMKYPEEENSKFNLISQQAISDKINLLTEN